MPIRFRCPKCSQSYSVSVSRSGSVIRCQKCEAKVRIPKSDAASAYGRSANRTASKSHSPVSEDETLFVARDAEDEKMDLTPMVDVTFLLLIFFMITASFSIQKSLEVPSPEPDEKGQMSRSIEPDVIEASVRVDIDEQNTVTVEEERVSNLDRLPAVLRGKYKPEVLIIAHEQAMHETVVKVVDAANEAGTQKIRMATRN